MSTQKIEAGSPFPIVTALRREGGEVSLAATTSSDNWKMVVVYRGRHCPMCTRYLNALEDQRRDLLDIGVEIVAVSADSEEQLNEHLSRLHVTYPICYGLTLEQMHAMGLYISQPRSDQETDHPFPEPGLFIINSDGEVQVVDLSNNPFARPDLVTLVNGLKWMRNPDNNYPIRGTYK
jgi:peroxiredoxin